MAKELKKRNNTEEESANFFASTPPLEAVKFLISEAMTKRVSRNNRPLKLSFIDVKKAHLCSDVLRELYVELHPKQTNHQILSGGCNEPCTARVTRRLRGNVSGFKSGVSNPALLHSEKFDASMVVHGDDFITLGDSEALSEVERAIITR